MEYKKNPQRHIRHWLSFPFIWMMIIPIFIMDIMIEIYHRICFPLYGIPIVKRSDYIRIDRHKLSYLRWWDKINCAYCGYANGFMGYALRIAGDTEKYWCAIKHKQTPKFEEPEHHKDFVPYGDEKAFKKRFSKRR